MKILITVDYFQPQVGYMQTFLAKTLLKKGHEVLVLTSDHFYPFPDYVNTTGKILGPRKQKIGYSIEEGIPTQREKLKFELFNRAYFENIEMNIKIFNPDIVVVTGVSSISAIRVAKMKNAYQFKLICLDSNLMSIINQGKKIKQIFYFFFRLFFSRFLETRVDKFVGIQEETCDIIHKFYGILPNRIEFIPLGTNIDKFRYEKDAREAIRTQLRLPLDAVVLIYTGKLILDKGYDLLIKSTAKVIQKHKKVYVIVVGSGSEDLIQEMNSYIAEIKDHYRFIDFVKNDALYQYFSASDVGIWPLQESVSMVEAAACQLPFIANDKIGTTLRISNNNALLYKQGDVEDLYQKISFLVENHEERIAMGKRGRELVEKELSWDTIAEKYLEF